MQFTSTQLTYDLLYTYEGLKSLDDLFLESLKNHDVDIYNKYLNFRSNASNLKGKELSLAIIEIAPLLEEFISNLFKINEKIDSFACEFKSLKIISEIKKNFIQCKVLKNSHNTELEEYVTSVKLIEDYFLNIIDDFNLATQISAWLNENNILMLEHVEKFCAWCLDSKNQPHKYSNLVIFNIPKKTHPEHLIENIINTRGEITSHEDYLIAREGFAHSDAGNSMAYVADHTNYCIFCHNQQKDSCSKGFKDEHEIFKKNVLNIELTGCPLEEKVSESNYLKNCGYTLSPLAVICIDNPMVAATGHRICNECMRACIYQKQEPVDIPAIESKILENVLNLPYGFEIYSLFTRWNPLNFKDPLISPSSGKKVLVAGMGPAGFTLSHYLLNSGHEVVGIDGLKIEPLNILKDDLIQDINTLYENLNDRVIYGFGGVAEYGITVRWDKNYLKIIRLLLERRKNFMLMGGIRLGSNITIPQAFELGFDHIGLCIGAGQPNILNIKNIFARGVRFASDFLMNLQLSGAAKENSLSNLQIRLPAIVIGGGLTAIDTATEILAYYPVQVEKFLKRIEEIGFDKLNYNKEEKIIALEFINHANEIRKEREKSNPDILKHLKKWGGVKVLYRKRLQDAPSYRLNYEEVEKAIREGFAFVENIIPKEIILDEFGHVQSILTSQNINDQTQEINFPAKAILIATGTSSNIVIAKEFEKYFKLENNYLSAIDKQQNTISLERSAKPLKTENIVYLGKDNSAISFYGDLHPSYVGNVVKAMASAKNGYQNVNELLSLKQTKQVPDFHKLVAQKLLATVVKVNRLGAKIIEVIISSPLAAKNFKPGQFYKLQNFEQNSSIINNTLLMMENIAVTGAWVDKEQGLISTIILEMGGSSSLCANLKPGEEVVLMGPTGEATHIEPKKDVLLIGGGLGNAVLFSIGKEFKEQNSHVTYLAGYRKKSDVFKTSEIEDASDKVIWACEEEKLSVNRSTDIALCGNIIEALADYASKFPEQIKALDKIIIIGSHKMMQAVDNYLRQNLKELLKRNISIIASINSPMQCMMKEICGQCIQKHIDSETGLESFVFSCTNQDQCTSKVDFDFLDQRLKQNSVQEKLTAAWIEHLYQI
jgi:NADPH-dependent glutamate synthase beta subunit-like oxidoreductase/NAD(P)H-flavin reductase